MTAFRQSLRATTLLLLASVSTTAFAAGKPALNPDQPAPATAPSKMSATVQFSLATLDRALERAQKEKAEEYFRQARDAVGEHPGSKELGAVGRDQ